MSLLTHGLSDYFNKAVASADAHAFPAVANFRGNMDPVRLIGTHVGAPVQKIILGSQQPHPHSMIPLIRALALTASR